jgi:hypothetical protein
MTPEEKRLRLLAALGIPAAALLVYAFLTSRVPGGAVLGAWSPVAGGLLFAATGLLAVLALVASGNRRAVSLLFRASRRCPEYIGSIAFFLVPGAAFLLWFLQPVPVTGRISFILGSGLLSFLPGLTVLFASKLRPTQVISNTALTGISILFALLVGEAALRELFPRSIFNPRFGLRPHISFNMQVSLPGVEPGGTLSTNSLGFRGEEPPANWEDCLTIVTVGGSTTANYYLDDSLTWSNVLQTRLREVFPDTWVGNAGIPRHSADTHALFVEEVLSKMKPDIAVFLVGVNDMGPFLRGQYSETGRLPDTGARTWLFANSMILQLAYKIKAVHFDGAVVIAQAVDPDFTEEPLEIQEMPLPDDLHDLLEDPGFYRRRISLIIDRCRELSIEPVFLTQPLLYCDNEYWRGISESAVLFQGTERPISAATFSLMLETLNRDLIEECNLRGVAVFDLASSVPNSRNMFYDSMHFTADGADLVGVLVSDFMLEYLDDSHFDQGQR